MSVEVYGGGGGASLKLQSKIVTPSTEQQIVTPDSGIDGLSKVTVDAMPGGTLAAPAISSGGLITSKIEKGGYLNAGDSRTLQLPTRGDQTIFPSTADQVAVPKGVFTTGQISVIGDANLIPGNIRSGVSIFGQTGTYQGEKTVSANSVSKSGNDILIVVDTGSDGLTKDRVKNLNFGNGIACQFGSSPADFFAVKGKDGKWNAVFWYRGADYGMQKVTAPISIGGHFLIFSITEIAESATFTFDETQIVVTYL